MNDVSDKVGSLGPGAKPSSVPVPLHRVRFVDWSPSAITALALSPIPYQGSTSAARSVLAVGRDNGNIDLCMWCEDTTSGHASVAKGWTPVMTLLGDEHYKIESLAFTVSREAKYGVVGDAYLRLFSSSGGSIVSEHFLPASIAYMGERSIFAQVPDPPKVPTRTLSSHGGAVWSMAASPTGKYLAIGCEDGVVRLIDVGGDAFEHVGTGMHVAPRMTRVASRILSLAWGPPRRNVPSKPKKHVSRQGAIHTDDSDDDEDDDDEDEDVEDEWIDTFLLGGLGNSTAAVWDIMTGQLRSRLTLLKNRQEHTIVWSVAVLRDGTLVTGDSTGRVTFFDARTRIPIPGATFQCHTAGADVLTLCVSADSCAVYSAGVDQKVVEYMHVGHAWTHTGTRRLHAHDIRALAIDPPLNFLSGPASVSSSQSTPTSMSNVPILISGGLDFHLVLTPASHASWRSKQQPNNPVSSSLSTSFADTTQRRVAFVPTNGRDSVVGVAPLKRWIMLRREHSIAIWALGDHESDPWHKVWELELSTRSNLGAAAISADGQFLAVSDLYETKLYSMQATPRRIASLGPAIHGCDVPAPGASALVFTPDSSRLVLCTVHGSYIHIVQLPASATDEPVLLKSFAQHRTKRFAAASAAGSNTPTSASASDGRVLSKGHVLPDLHTTTPLSEPANHKSSAATTTELGSGREVLRDSYAPILLSVVSPDGQWLLTADAARRMHVFHLDTLSYQRALASPVCVPSSACFHPTHPSLLAIALPTNQVLFYDLEADDAPAWEASLRHEVDAQLGRIREPVVGCMWLSGNEGACSLVLYGPTWLCTARPLTTRTSVRKKRRNGQDDPTMGSGESAWSVRTTFKYQPLLYVGAMSTNEPELLVVERPYFALAQSLPPAFYRGAKYGM